MKRGKVTLDDLKVESFETGSQVLGGVYGHQSIDPTCQVNPSEPPWCATNEPTGCYPHPVWTCGETCLWGEGCDTLGADPTCINADPPCPG